MVAHLRLGHSAKRKEDPPEALPIELIEHVGLVLGRIDGGMQLTAVDDSRVVASRQPVETQVEHPAEHEVEPYECVAAHAGVGRAALEVVAVKRLDDPLAELLLEVPAVIRNVEQGRDAARVLDGVERTAPAVLCRLLGITARPLLQRHGDHLVALRLEQRGRDRGIDAARHRHGNFHRRTSTMCRATTSASSPTPYRIDDLFFLIQCTPMKYKPGTVERPLVCAGNPMSSKTGNLTHP